MIRLIVISLMFFVSGAYGEDRHGHMKYHHQFYQKLKQPGSNLSCCNDKDCRPARHRVTQFGRHEFFVAGRWLRVAKTKLIEDIVTPDGGGHWCGVNENTPRALTFCGIVPFQAF